MGYWPEWYGIQVEKCVFLEAEEAKTMIDSHHAQISHAINRYVYLGFDISEGQDIENAIQNICDTSQVMGKILCLVIRIGLSSNGLLQEKLEKLCKKDIHKPNPGISTHTTPCSDWEIPIPNAL
ncbi:18220_t:CDS:2, partial [Racocetra persica]